MVVKLGVLFAMSAMWGMLIISQSVLSLRDIKKSENTLDIANCDSNKERLVLSDFVISNGEGQLPMYDTNVSICYNETNHALVVNFTMFDDTPYSPYYTCNQPLYNYDAVEFFIAPKYNNKYQITHKIILCFRFSFFVFCFLCIFLFCLFLRICGRETKYTHTKKK